MDAKQNGPAFLGDFERSVTRIDEQMRHIFWEKPKLLPKIMLVVVGTNLSDISVVLNQAAIDPFKKEGEKKNVCHKHRRYSTLEINGVPKWPHGQTQNVKTVDDNQLGIDRLGTLNILEHYAHQLQNTGCA